MLTEIKTFLRFHYKKMFTDIYTNPDIIDIHYVAPLQLWIKFADGKNGVYNFTRLTQQHPGGVFSRLLDDNYFKSVKIENHTITWCDGVDIAPESLYHFPEKYGAKLRKNV